MTGSVLQTRALSFGYGRRTVLEELDLEARSGEVTAVVGPNGAGKTTLLRLLGGLLPPAAGEVLLAGRPVGTLDRRQVARQIAVSPQFENANWRLSVEQMVLLGRAPHRGWILPFSLRDREVVAEALASMELEELSERSITELSGGELRRVLFARILAQEPRVALLDEPTAHLDLRHQEEVSCHLRRLAQEKDVAVVTTLHDLNQTAAYADRVALLHRCRLRAFGRPEEVLTPESLEAAYGIGVSVAEHPGSGRLWITPSRVPEPRVDPIVALRDE